MYIRKYLNTNFFLFVKPIFNLSWGAGNFAVYVRKNQLIGKVSWILVHFIKEARRHGVKSLFFKWLNIRKTLIRSLSFHLKILDAVCNSLIISTHFV